MATVPSPHSSCGKEGSAPPEADVVIPPAAFQGCAEFEFWGGAGFEEGSSRWYVLLLLVWDSPNSDAAEEFRKLAAESGRLYQTLPPRFAPVYTTTSPRNLWATLLYGRLRGTSWVSGGEGFEAILLPFAASAELWRRLLYDTTPDGRVGAGSGPPAPADPGSDARQEIERLNRLHRLAGRCVNAVLRLHHLRHCGDGDRHGHAALIELRDAVAALPPLPLAEDPFCRDDVITVAGVTATSAHAASWALAERTWQGAQLRSLRPETATQHAEGTGTPYTRVALPVVRRAPTEGAWSVDVWREVCAALDDQPAPEADWFQAALLLEWNQACRRLEDRGGAASAATRAAFADPSTAAAVAGPPSPERSTVSATGSTPRHAPSPPLRSWTQSELDAAIREYKSKRAVQYKDLVEAVRQGKRGAQKTAQKLYGRNALARALGVKAPAMVSKSEAWEEIAADLQLARKRGDRPVRNQRKRIGLDIAAEGKAGEDPENTGCLDEVIRKETIAFLRRELPPEEAEETITKLQRGAITDDQARALIDLYREQCQDDRAKKILRSD
jgi:hypothetical protein